MWDTFKNNNKGTRICKVNDKANKKDTIDVVLASLLLTLSTFYFLLQCFYCWLCQLIAGWGCYLLFWRFVAAGINLGNFSRRRDKFDGQRIFEGKRIYGGKGGLYSGYWLGYIFGGVYSRRLIYWGRINGILRY